MYEKLNFFQNTRNILGAVLDSCFVQTVLLQRCSLSFDIASLFAFFPMISTVLANMAKTFLFESGSKEYFDFDLPSCIFNRVIVKSDNFKKVIYKTTKLLAS